MKIALNFKVRNPEWYWPETKIKESEGYYETWKILNEDKIYKHIPSWSYEINFDVVDVKENRNADYELRYSNPHNKGEIKSLILNDMTFVTFYGSVEKVEVAISNAIIFSFMGAQKSGSKYYWYFYIKENIEFERLTDLIFISKDQNLILESFL